MPLTSYYVSPKAEEAIKQMLEQGETAPVLQRETIRGCGPPGGLQWIDSLYLSIPGEQFDRENCIELVWLAF